MKKLNGAEVFDEDADPAPEAVVWRSFWAEQGAVVDLVATMRHVRQSAQVEASKLSASIGASRVVLTNGSIYGFIFNKDDPDKRFFHITESVHDLGKIWIPRVTTKKGQAIRHEMNKVHYPDFSEAVDSTPFPRAIRPPSHFGSVFHSVLGFYDQRVVLSVPFWTQEYIDWLFRQPENWDASGVIREWTKAWACQLPWHEWTDQERRQYATEFEAKIQENRNV